MPPGIAVALRVERAGVVLVDEAVGVLVVDVVVDVVGGFAEALGVVPEHPVVDRVALAEIGAAQQRQFLVQQVGLHVLEGVGEGGDACEAESVVRDRDGRVLRIAVGLAGQQFIEHGQAGGGEQQRLVDAVGAHRIAGVVDRELLGALPARFR